MFFSNTHWPQLTAPFYSILFETSICQFNRSKCSSIRTDEVREHLTGYQRPFLHPESLQILQIPSIFSSVHLTHVLQGSGQRTGMDIAEAWFCAQWPIFCDVFEVCVWIIVRLKDPNMAHYKISNRVSHLLISFIFDRIHDAMCLNKMSRTSSKNIAPQHQQYSSVFHCKHGVLFVREHQTHIECLLLKS